MIKNSHNFISISLLRFISLQLIIWCHIMQWYNLELAWWLNVGVQTFLCISGYLYGRKKTGDIISYYAKRLSRILIPYYLIYIPYGILIFLFAREEFSLDSFIRGLFVNGTLKGAGHLWFVSTILLCYFFTPIIEVYRDRYVSSAKNFKLFLLCSITIIIIFFCLFQDYYNPIWICNYIVGYCIGINEDKKLCDINKYLVVIGFMTIFGNTIQIYCSYFLDIKLDNWILWSLFCDFNHLMLGTFIFCLFKELFDKANLKRLGTFLSLTDKYGYEIYLVHQLLILSPFSLMKVTKYIFINIILINIGIFLLAWFLKKIEIFVIEYANRIHERILNFRNNQ